MPTFNEVDPHGTTDMGWGLSRITARHPVTSEPTAVEVVCKSCLVAFVYQLDHGRVVSGFDHLPTCPIYAGIHAHTVHEVDPRRPQ